MLKHFPKILIFAFFWQTFTFAETKKVFHQEWGVKIGAAIQPLYPNAKIKVKIDKLKLSPDQVGLRLASAELVKELRPGVAELRLKLEKKGQKQTLEKVHVSYEAVKSLRIAKQKLFPRQKLSEELFRLEEVNVADPVVYESRKSLVDDSIDISQFETTRTIMKGSAPLITGIKKIPDVRIGDVVKVLIKSGNLVLTTSGRVQENAYRGDSVRIHTVRPKKEFVGSVTSSKAVEVKL